MNKRSLGLKSSELNSRPERLDQIIHHEQIVKVFQGIQFTRQLPHLIMYGPPGTGKTSIILAFLKEVFGPDHYKERVMEMNASDDRGIQKVREKIKRYAETKMSRLPPEYPHYKVIILDEADQMTVDAQHALRRIIEDYSSVTRFCLICNYITKIIEPLNSRCVKFQFKKIPVEQQLAKLNEICDNENLEVPEGDIINLINLTDGDLRKSVNLLQLARISFASNRFNYDNILQISDVT